MTAWDTHELPIEKLYGMQISYEDNAIVTRYDSGRAVAWQRNTAVKRRYAVTYFATAAQARFFDRWYRTVLGGNGMSFTAPSLEGDGTTKTYRMESPPKIDGMGFKHIQMEWIEV